VPLNTEQRQQLEDQIVAIEKLLKRHLKEHGKDDPTVKDLRLQIENLRKRME
jgi:ribosomal protein S15P/S13E